MTSVAGRPKNDTTTPSTKSTPLMITASPPCWDPVGGLISVIRSTSGATYTKALSSTIGSQSGLATSTSTGYRFSLPGVTAVMTVSLDDVDVLWPALPSMRTVAPGSKPLPVMPDLGAPGGQPRGRRDRLDPAARRAATRSVFVASS